MPPVRKPAAGKKPAAAKPSKPAAPAVAAKVKKTRTPAASRPFNLYAVDGDQLAFLVTVKERRPDFAVSKAVKEKLVDANTPIVPIEQTIVRDPYAVAEVIREPEYIVTKAKGKRQAAKPKASKPASKPAKAERKVGPTSPPKTEPVVNGEQPNPFAEQVSG